jgi:hypothetical protein
MPDPDENENARDYRIAAGQSFVPRRKLSFFPPFGTETYKIFASYDPLDFRPIFRLKGQGDSRGLENPLEKLFKESYTMSRGTASSTLSSDANACTFSYTFRIVK